MKNIQISSKNHGKAIKSSGKYMNFVKGSQNSSNDHVKNSSFMKRSRKIHEFQQREV